MSITSSTGLLVISVDSKNFSNTFMHKVLPKLSLLHKKVNVVIAVELMVYNRYNIGLSLENAKRVFQLYYSERFDNITKIIQHYQLANIEVQTYNHFCDQNFSNLFRRFWRIAMSDPLLMNAINEKTRWFVDGRIKLMNSMSDDDEFSVVKQFVMEETAWSIHMAEHFGITDEYYPKDHASLLKYIYHYENSEQFLSLLNANNHARKYWSIDIDKENIFTEEWNKIQLSSSN
jgi:hypothetical protein